MDTLEAKKIQRFLFMNLLYEKTDGNENKQVDTLNLGHELGFTQAQTELIVQYLEGKDLVESVGLDRSVIFIRHKGVVEVEAALANREQPTRYFPSVVNVVNFHAQVSNAAFQQGTHGSTQTVSFTIQQQQDLCSILNEIKQSIDDLGLDMQQQSDIRAEIGTIEAQLTSSKPKYSVITECLKSLRNILEGTVGSLIASGILVKLAALTK